MINLDRAAISIAFGSEYVSCAKVMVKSFRQANPDLIMQLHLIEGTEFEIKEPPMELVWHPPPPAGWPMRDWGRSARMTVMAKTLFRRVWVTDADSVILKSLDPGFRIIEEGYDIAAPVAGCNPLSNAHFRSKYPEVVRKFSPKKTVYSPNMFCRMNAITRSLWVKAHEYYLPKRFYDMPALNRAIYETPDLKICDLNYEIWLREYPGNSDSIVAPIFGNPKIRRMKSKGLFGKYGVLP